MFYRNERNLLDLTFLEASSSELESVFVVYDEISSIFLDFKKYFVKNHKKQAICFHKLTLAPDYHYQMDICVA